MEVRILTDKKNELELEFIDADRGLIQYLSDELNKKEEVEFAAYNLEHPIVSNPVLIIKAKDPKKMLKEVLDELEKEVKKFSKEFSRM